jgi:hypothetical protein
MGFLMDEDDYQWRRVVVPRSREQLTTKSASLSARSLAAARATKVLLGCYRSGEANDPEVYTTAMIATLSDFPEHIIRAVCDPRHGLPARSKWLPTVSEVRSECDYLNEAELAELQRKRDFQAQMQGRREWEESKKNKPTYEELLEKHGANWGLLTAPGEDRRKQLAAIEDANQRAFAMECRSAGMDPERVHVSPSLTKLMRQKLNDETAEG